MTQKGRPALDIADDVHACQAQGLTQRATAEQLGVSLSAVCKHWKHNAKRGRPSENAARVAELTAQGKSAIEIAKELGLDRSTVTRYRSRSKA